MYYSDDHDHEHHMPFFLKAIILAAAGIFAIIGVIGLVLPIIPGILFLALAALLLSRVSSRFRFHLNNYEGWNKFNDYFRSISYLSIGRKIKLTVWLQARSLLNLLEAGIRSVFRRR